MSAPDNSRNCNLVTKLSEYDKQLPEDDSTKVSSQRIVKPYLNKPVNCPWTSRAPLTSTGNLRSSETNPEGTRASNEASIFKEHCNNGGVSNGFGSKYRECHRASSTQFFHFLRLMQLFPEVHPATLHTVMTLCKNDFFSTVDKLLYAKKCKDLVLKRRQILLTNNKGKMRYQPYSFKPDCNDNVKLVLNYKNSGVAKGCQLNNQQTQTVWDSGLSSKAFDSERLAYKNKSKTRDSKPEIPDFEFVPVASPQLELPIRPLSPTPDVVQDLTKSACNIKDEK
ncbi:hypothetical protein Trydic_g23672 [Trypoxylus dichotomus]